MTKKTAIRPLVAAIPFVMGGYFPSAALAQDTPAQPGVSIELSSADTLDGACRISFLAQNDTGHAIDQAVYETVLFGTGGEVLQLTLLDFRDLPAGRPRVRQFQFAETACTEISRVLINGAQTCTAQTPGACIDGLRLSTRTKQELIG
ncbi:MAG: hypothetical protein OIF47_00620 [Marinibacterium sp.]|nr:hypothetical protein [Marinibacterium sp.]